MEDGLDIAIVAATFCLSFAVAGVVSAWADRRFPAVALVVLGLTLGTFGWIHIRLPGGLRWQVIPESFILVVARIVN